MQDLIVIIVVLALFFDFTNGFHDTANAIATSVSTRALKPRTAVILAAVLNFLGAFVSIHVAATVAKGVVDSNFVTPEVVFAGISGAILWNLFTWRVGMPTSSSHALIGGVAGAALVGTGLQAILWEGLAGKVIVPSLVAPALGLAGAALVMVVITRLVSDSSSAKSQNVFRRLQIASASFVAFTHGTNDAQKTMGIITLALIAGGVVPAGEGFHVPLWVIVSAAAAMALGTYFGGWRIIHTLGQRIVELKPREGFAAETSTATILFATAQLGFPVSTTHTISSSIVGAGTVENHRGINWTVIKQILLAWLLTLPCAMAVGALIRGITLVPGGEYFAFAVVVLVAFVVLVTRHLTRDSYLQVRERLRPITTVKDLVEVTAAKSAKKPASRKRDAGTARGRKSSRRK